MHLSKYLNRNYSLTQFFVRIFHFAPRILNGAGRQTRQAGKIMTRVGPPPVFGRPGYYYNHPDLTVAISVGTDDVSAYKHGLVLNFCDSFVYSTNYLVDVPFGVFPGEIIRVLVKGTEYLVVCPEITHTGERIAITTFE